MMQRLFEQQLLISWVVADTVYGGNLDLRTWLEAHGYPYVLAVACNEPVGIQTPDGRRRRVEVQEVEALLLSDYNWQRLSTRCGTKGPRLFDWAVVSILHRWQDDEHHFLLIRRCIDDPLEKAYYFVFARHQEPPCKRWSKRSGRDGTWRRILKTGKIWAWTTMRSEVGSAGIAM